MIQIKKISKHVVTPINLPTLEPDKIKGYDLIPKLYCAIFICAKKESGKTNTIFKILKECTGKKTHLYIISSTVFNDPNWEAIVDHFEKKGITMTVSTSLDEAGIPEKVQELIAKAKQEQEDKKNKNEDKLPKNNLDLFDHLEDKPERKPKKIAPEYIFVFDDMSHELQNKDIATLLKKHRHFKTKIICSSQYINDLRPDSRKNVDIFILFQGHSNDKLFELYTKNLDLRIPYELFIKLYEHATAKPYSFLYVDKNKPEFRRNFNCQYQLM